MHFFLPKRRKQRFYVVLEAKTSAHRSRLKSKVMTTSINNSKMLTQSNIRTTKINKYEEIQ